MKIRVYKVESGFSNVPDNFTLKEPNEGIYEELWYELPEGWEISENAYGENMVANKEGELVALCQGPIKSNVLLAVGRGEPKALRRALGAPKISIRDARLKLGVSRQQLADLSGVTYKQLSRLENGEAQAGNMDAKNLLAIADALQVNPYDLI